MNVWGDRRAGAWLAAGLASAATALCLLRSVGAQTPTGPSSLPLCPSAFSLVDFPLDSTLAPSLETAWVRDERVIRLSWDTGSGATCAFFQVQDYAGGYSGSGTIAGADFITGAGQGARLRSPGSSGKKCFRLFAISFRGRSRPVEACVEVPAGGVPTPRPPGSAPPPSGTPWPAPSSAKLEGRVLLLDENNFPLPPSQQAWFTGISWATLPGFPGYYEVQRAQLRRSEALSWESLPSGYVPASLSVNGRVSVEEWVSVGSTWCFRVRTLVNSPTSIETGPFSQEVCQQLPPSSGGVGTATITPAPLPPDAGNSWSSPNDRGWQVAAGLVVTAALMTTAIFGRRRR